MKIVLQKLLLTCKEGVEEVEFKEITYLYGEIGAGKSTVARLIDYCLGSKSLVMTPALQSEFVSVTLILLVEGTPASLRRDRGSQQIQATWGKPGEENYLAVPARKSQGVLMPGTDVEILSDLIFHIGGRRPPKVRRSQIRDDSDLERMSLRDLLWYCYLDQDHIDSNFFQLGRDADVFRRLKSRNVLRFVLGVHQENVAELEVAIEKLRRERASKAEASRVLIEALQEIGFQSAAEIESELAGLRRLEKTKVAERDDIRRSLESLRTHAVDTLRAKGRLLAEEIESTELAIRELRDISTRDSEHLNEILSLSMKVRRVTSARAVLNGLDFGRCPRCTQILPERSAEECVICGQQEPSFQAVEDDTVATEADLKERVKELRENLEAHKKQTQRAEIHLANQQTAKNEIDRRLQEATSQYDSAYLSSALELENEIAELTQRISYLDRMSLIPSRAEGLRKAAAALEVQEREYRSRLRESRDKAEQDSKNLDLLREFFLDCLMRSEIAGFTEADEIIIQPPDFYPEARSEEAGELITTSFSTLGSGGKKTLFKACYALAFHRLARSEGAILPALLVIDSPMKNISERENREQFEGFYRLVYELAQKDLADTQIVIIDKEFTPPKEGELDILARHMKVDDQDHPPLISYYRGK